MTSDTTISDLGVGADDLVELIVPARTELAATVRIVAASLGADMGFTVDEIDDLRLALNEVFTSAADSVGDERVSVSFRPRAPCLDVTVVATGPAPIELDDLAEGILRSVVDDVQHLGGAVSFTKHAAESTA